MCAEGRVRLMTRRERGGGKEERERAYIQSHECLLEGSGSRVASMTSLSSPCEHALSPAGNSIGREEDDEERGMEGGGSAPSLSGNLCIDQRKTNFRSLHLSSLSPAASIMRSYEEIHAYRRPDHLCFPSSLPPYFLPSLPTHLGRPGEASSSAPEDRCR